eukprot:Pgem_evm2s17123
MLGNRLIPEEMVTSKLDTNQGICYKLNSKSCNFILFHFSYFIGGASNDVDPKKSA